MYGYTFTAKSEPKLKGLRVLPWRNLWDQSERYIWYFIHILGKSNPDNCAILPANADDLN